MEKHSYDVEVGPEIVDSLAKALKDCRQQLMQSEENAKELENSNKLWTEHVDELKKENNRLMYEIAGARDTKSVAKVEEDIIPKSEAKETNVETNASQYADMEEKYQKEKTELRQARERCDELTTQLTEVKEKYQKEKTTRSLAHENCDELMAQLAEFEEKYQKEKTKRCQAREDCDELTAQLAEFEEKYQKEKTKRCQAREDCDELTAQLAEFDEKCQKEKTKRCQARERCNELTTQLAEVTGEETALKKRIGDLEDALEKLKKDFESRKAIPLHNERKMLKDAMEQRPFERPQVQVGPISKYNFTTATFRKFLSSNPKLQALASPDRSICLQYSDPFLWCRKPGGHALLFAPCHKLQLDDVEAKWISHPMKEMYGITKELFAITRNTAHYEGTYKCLPLSCEMFPDGCKDLSGLSLEALARATISDNGVSHKLYQDSFQTIMDLWKANILRAECIGLQYVGFNENLYHTLVPMGRKLQGDEAVGSTGSKVEVRANSKSKRKTVGPDDDRESEHSGNNEDRTKRRRG